MCGRYYVDDSTAREIEKLVRKVDENLRRTLNLTLQAGDVRPTDAAPVLTADDHEYRLFLTPEVSLCCRKECFVRVRSTAGS